MSIGALLNDLYIKETPIIIICAYTDLNRYKITSKGTAMVFDDVQLSILTIILLSALYSVISCGSTVVDAAVGSVPGWVG